MLTDYFNIFFAAVFANNIILTKFLGLCPFLGSTNRLNIAINMSFATTFVLTTASVVSYFVYQYLLIPFNLEFLKIIMFIFFIALLVGFCEVFIEKNIPLLHRKLGIYLPLITTNCAVLGVALLNLQIKDSNLFTSLFFGLGNSAGFSFIMIVFASLRYRNQLTEVPQSFQGVPIAFINAGIIAMVFSIFGTF